MFIVTEAAAEQIKEAAKQGGTEGMALRMAARKKDDGSIEYIMGFDEEREQDTRVDADGTNIVISPDSVALLEEAVMDYVEMAEGDFRFIFLNPKDPTYVPPSDG
ncbi:MAG: iron-sulfur cluster assembly accessory protein [Candidatus Sedimenticola sp. (ex Thyasira tokunagai)]